MVYEKLMNIIPENLYNKIIEINQKNNIFMNLNNKSCLIIGNNNSIKEHKFSEYIDNFTGIVIRVNFRKNSEFIPNYGNKTDMLVYYEYFAQNTNLSITKIISDELKHSIFDSAIKENIDIFHEYKYIFTTGFMTILCAICYFENVEIYGFGNYNQKDEVYKNGYIKSIHNVDTINYDKKIRYHDIDLEHSFLDKLEDKKILKRLESNIL